MADVTLQEIIVLRYRYRTIQSEDNFGENKATNLDLDIGHVALGIDSLFKIKPVVKVLGVHWKLRSVQNSTSKPTVFSMLILSTVYRERPL